MYLTQGKRNVVPAAVSALTFALLALMAISSMSTLTLALERYHRKSWI
jgi:hypothetical protein